MFEKGDVVVDDKKQRLGEIMQVTNRINSGSIYVLRPPRGGIEWEAPVGRCRKPEPDELVSADAMKRVEPTT